ncbi:AMP-binding protein [Streptomyces scabiei]|uniref:AMP-binding protein n=1 Tax=Streptomyces scabiei TaxID=1930 RepID=UPI0035ABDFF3
MPWPEPCADDYRARGYWNDEILGSLPMSAPGARDRPAVVTATRTLTYGEMDRAADRLAAGLRGLGLGSGDRVVVQLPNDVELLVLCIALFRLGALPVFAYPAHRAAEIVHLVNSAEAVMYVCADEALDCDYRIIAKDVLAGAVTLRHVLVAGDPGPFAALAEVDGDPVDLPVPDAREVAFFLLSGGTSGPPKLVPRTHADYAYQLRQSSRLCGFRRDTRYLCALPMGHNFALGCPGVLGTLRMGGTVVPAMAPTPELCFPLIESAGVTVTSLSPPLVSLWLDAAERTAHHLGSLELLQVGEARLSPGTARRVSGGSAVSCSRCTAWRRACSTTRGSTTPRTSSSIRRAAPGTGRRDTGDPRGRPGGGAGRGRGTADPRPLHGARLLPGRGERPSSVHR